MSSISAYGATIKVTQAGVYITPSRLAQALEHIPHLVPIDRITGATELSPPTAYGLGAVELTGTTEVIRFAPGQAANMTTLIDAVTDAVQGNAPALVPGLHFVGVDVETANADWGSICQIGVVRVVDGMQVDSHEWLCQPPAGIDHFDEGNIRIHGITPDMVTDAPDFATVFPEVVAYVADQVLVAHNAQFDLTAFSRACHATGTPVPHWKFACSLAASRAAKLGITSHRLPVVAQHLGVELDKHREAVADALAFVADDDRRGNALQTTIPPSLDEPRHIGVVHTGFLTQENRVAPLDHEGDRVRLAQPEQVFLVGCRDAQPDPSGIRQRCDELRQRPGHDQDRLIAPVEAVDPVARAVDRWGQRMLDRISNDGAAHQTQRP